MLSPWPCCWTRGYRLGRDRHQALSTQAPTRVCMDACRHEHVLLVTYGAQPPASSSQHESSSWAHSNWPAWGKWWKAYLQAGGG